MICRNVHRFAAVRTLGLGALSASVRKSGISMMLAMLWLCASGWQLAAQTNSVRDAATTFTTLLSFDGTDGAK